MKKYILGAVLSFGILSSPLFASAAGLTSSQISAIMQLLQAFGADQSVISNVQVALTGGAPTTGGQSFCHNFSSDLTVGNGGNDVSALNQALTLSGIDTTSNTVSFTENTAGDVVSFQARYGIRQTGYVGPLTRGKLNALYGCGNNQVPAPTPLPIVPQPTPITPQPVQTPVTLAPIIQVVTPTSAAPGSTVTINGGTFDSSSYISIGNVPGGVNSRSITPNSVNSNGMALSFIIPSDMGAGTFPIYVAEKGTNFVSNSATLTVVVAKQSPTISSISPNQGTTAGTASIYGTNLTSGGNPTVEFHSSSGTLAGVVSFVNMNYISPQQLIFNLNATNATNGSSITLQPGVYQVDVLTPNGTSNSIPFTLTTGVSSASLVTCSVTQQTVPVYTNPFSISWSSTNSVYGMGPYGDKIDTQGSATYQLTAGQEKLYTFTFFNAAGQSTTCSTFFSSLKG
jgi:hypothetical protein